MDALPLELVDLIIGYCPAITQPLAALVCRGWNRLMERNRAFLPQHSPVHFYRSLSCGGVARYMAWCRRAQDADYKDKLANAKRTIYACRLVKAQHGALIEWAFTQGGFVVTGKVLSKAAATGNLDLVKWLVARCGNGSGAGFSYPITRGAAKSGSIDILEWAHVTISAACTETTFIRLYKRAIDTAARYNQRHAIEWLMAHGHAFNCDVSTVAAAAGHLDLLRWLYDLRRPVHNDSLAQVAAGFADLDTFDWFSTGYDYLHRIAYREAVRGDCLARLVRVHARNGQISVHAWLLAAKRGDLAMCEWLLSVGCPKNNDAFERAIRHRHLDVVLWLRDHGFTSEPRHFLRCALKGDIDALEWLSHHGFDIMCKDMVRNVACHGHMDVLEWLHSRYPIVTLAPAAGAAARSNQWHMVQWLGDRGCKFVDPGLCASAVRFERLDMLQYLHAQGCLWDESSCVEAAASGQLATLQWLHTRGCPWDVRTCASAIRGRHYAIAEWALDRGCPYDASLCATVAMQRALHYLKRLRERGIPWDCDTCFNAAKYGHLETLQWAIANGCPHSLKGCREVAAHARHSHIASWINDLLPISF